MQDMRAKQVKKKEEIIAPGSAAGAGTAALPSQHSATRSQPHGMQTLVWGPPLLS
jgi:hypothetical protein